MKPRSALFSLVPSAALLLLATLCASCGHRDWPKPVAVQDSFSFAKADGRQDGGCLMVEATVHGTASNLDRVFLQLEEVGDDADCIDCPFVPRTRVDFELSDRRLSFDGERLELRYCGVTADKSYRFRLVGVNVHDTLGEVMTPVLPPQQSPK